MGIQVQVRYYARLKDLTGTHAESLQLDAGASVRDLLTRLFSRYPQLLGLEKSLLVARNDEYASAEQMLGDGDIVDLMPPVSGG